MKQVIKEELERRERKKAKLLLSPEDRLPAPIPAEECTYSRTAKMSKSDVEQAITLFNQGATPETIQLKTGLRVGDLLALKLFGDKIKPLSDQIKEILANQWYMLAEACLQELSERRLDKLPAGQLATIAGIAQDKARLMEGKPTEVIAQYIKVMEQIMIDVNDEMGEERAI